MRTKLAPSNLGVWLSSREGIAGGERPTAGGGSGGVSRKTGPPKAACAERARHTPV